MKKNKGWGGYVRHLAGTVLILGLVACASPQEKESRYIQHADALLAKGDDVKAGIEYRNALQINPKSVPALKGLVSIAEKRGQWQQMYAYLSQLVAADPKETKPQLQLGTLLLAAGHVSDAMSVSDKLMQQDGSNPAVLAFRAAVFLKKGDIKSATDFAQQALAKNPTTVDAFAVLAAVELSSNNIAGSLEDVNKGLAIDGGNMPLLFMKIALLEKQGNLDQAAAVYQTAIAAHPVDDGLKTLLAQFYVRHGMLDKAEAVLRASATAVPVNVAAQIELARFLNQYHGASVAQQSLQDDLKQSPDSDELKFALVDLYRSQHNATSEMTVLNDVIAHAQKPDDALKARNMLASMAIQDGKPTLASQYIQQVLSVDARNEQALLLKASMEIDARQFDQAIADLRTILHDAPNSARALFLMGKAEQSSGRPDLADQNYSQAFNASHKAPEIGMPYASYLMQRHQTDAASQVYRGILEHAPHFIPALVSLAQLQIGSADWSGAMQTVSVLKQIPDAAAVTDKITGIILSGQKDLAGGLAAFQRAYALAPNDEQLVEYIPRTEMMENNPQAALDFLASVLQKNPDDVVARVLRGRIELGLKKTDEALADWQTAISRAPHSPLGYRALSGWYLENKQYAEAQKVLTEGLAAVPDDGDLGFMQAQLDDVQGQHAAAIKQYQALLDKAPGSLIVINNLVSAIDSYQTDMDSLQRAYTLAQALQGSQVPYFKDTFGWASYKVGKPVDAVSYLSSAAAALPNEAVFQYHLGMAEMANANKQAASDALNKALQLSGNDPELHQQVVNGLQTLAAQK